MTWLNYEGVVDPLNKINGIEYLGQGSHESDCLQFAIGSTNGNLLVPGVIEHNGNPESRDIILYGKNLQNPLHAGI